MITAQPNPVREPTVDEPQDAVDGLVYRWYDPDAAAFADLDPLAELDADEDTAAPDLG
jgi:hypothetical protein